VWFLLFVVFLLLPAIGLAFPAEALDKLAFGWIYFLSRVIPTISWSPSGLLSALVWGTGCIWGLHGFARWFVSGWHAGSSQTTPESRRWSWRWTAAGIGLIITAFAAGIAITGLAHQGLWLATSPEPLLQAPQFLTRTLSRNHLQQLGLAVRNLIDRDGEFPAGAIFDDAGRPLHGWQTGLLPFLGYDAVARRIDLARSWNDPANAAALRTPIPEFLNPGFPAPTNATDRLAETHYSGNALLLRDRRLKAFADIPDGTSNTILAGEIRDRFVPWGQPMNVRDLRLGINQSAAGFGSPFAEGMHILMADGSVRFISDSMEPQTLKSLATPAGDEPIPAW
jgi:hypothetical protein